MTHVHCAHLLPTQLPVGGFWMYHVIETIHGLLNFSNYCIFQNLTYPNLLRIMNVSTQSKRLH